jgi:tetratricopeptide (TPR) repeat protein
LKKLVLLSLIVTTCFFGFSQTEHINTSNPKIKDTIKIIDLIKKSEAIEFTDPKRAIELYKEAYHLSLKSKYDEGAFKSTLYIGLVHSNIAQYDSALYYLDKSKVINKNINSELNDAKIFLNRANVFMFQGKIEKSIENHIDGIRILEKRKDSLRLGNAFANLSSVYQQLDDFDKQIEFLQKSLYVTPNNEIKSKGMTHCDLALPFLMKKDFKSSLFHLKKADSISKLIDDKILNFFVNRNWGEYYLFQDNYNSAIPYHERALKLAKTYNYSYYEHDIAIGLGDAYLNLDRYKEAEVYLIDALKLANEKRLFELSKKALFMLAAVQEGKGNYKAAFNYMTQHNHLKDSLISDKNITVVKELDTKYQTEKKDKEIVQQQLELEKSQAKTQTMTILIISLLLASILLWFVFQQRQKRIQQQLVAIQKEQEIRTLESLISGEEKERLRISQELHDGVNGDLSAIKFKLSSLLKMNNEVINEAVNMIDNSCKQVRAISHNLVPPSLKDFSLLEAVTNYCENMNTIHEPQILFQSVGASIDLNKKIEVNIFRIIQELVTNAIKHAEATVINVQISNQNNNLLITVEDNGKGYSDITDKKPGIGLENIQSRIDYLNANLEVETNKTGTYNTIEIDLNKLNDN